MSFADALTLADEDILAHWEEYRNRFLWEPKVPIRDGLARTIACFNVP